MIYADARACVLLKDGHTVFKNNTTDCFCICFMKQGGGESRFLRDPKGGMFLGLTGGSRFFKGSKRGVKKIL